MRSDIRPNPWTRLREFTDARIGLGRSGDSLPTRALLDFQLAHALARDAVHTPMDVVALERSLIDAGFGKPIIVQSEARDRTQFLLRPDMGRRLGRTSRGFLTSPASEYDVVFVIADGLSSVATARHALPLLKIVTAELTDWRIAPVVVATQARVALGDAVGSLLHAAMTVMLIGERPGLSSPDSMGIYLTFAPREGLTDADRNCISNVRPEGLPCHEAARKLLYLMRESRQLKISGVALKDDSDAGEFLPDPATS